MNTFKDIPFKVRLEFLKELPRGAAVVYKNPSSSLHNDRGIKIKDHGNTMKVMFSDGTYDISYKRLSCEGIENAIAVTKKITPGVR